MKEATSCDEQAVDRPSAIVAGACLTAIGALPFNVMPLLLGSAAEHLQLGDAQLGIFAGCYLAGACLATIAAPFWIRRVSWRGGAVLGTAIGMPALLGCSATRAPLATMAALFVAGLGLATSYAPGLALIGDTSRPDRNFGVLLLLQTSLAAFVGVGLPGVDTARGFAGIMQLLAGISALNLLCVPWIPRRGTRAHIPRSGRAGGSNLPVVAALSAHFVFFVSVTAIWPFLELLANSVGISDAQVGIAISSSLLISGLGALAAALVGERIRSGTGIAIGALGMMAPALALLRIGSFGSYFVSVCVFQSAWSFGIAYQFGLIATLDVTGRFMVLATAFATTGGVLGPVLGGALAEGAESYAGPIGFGLATMGLSLVMYLWCAGQRRQTLEVLTTHPSKEDWT